MMGRRSSAEVYAPHSPITSFAGQDGTSRLQKEYLSECESIPYNYLSAAAVLAFSTHEPFFNTAATFDCPPPLLPANNPHYYVPFHQPPQYSPGLIERDDRVTLAAGGRIGLNLGQRTYFSPSDGLLSRPRAMCSAPAHLLPPRCQVEGCGADLSAAKNYHRRHKVCNFHSKASAVVAHGLHQRFCQQCSRFHVLAEFDEAKRSCRKRLADHNRRRRKPQLISAAAATTPPTAKSKGTTAVPACPTTVSAQEIQLRDEQGLSQGRRGMSCNSMCQTEAVLIGAAVEEDKLSQQQHAQSFPISESNSSFFTHQKGPDFNGALLAIGGDASSHRASPHLGQFMFELDFL